MKQKMMALIVVGAFAAAGSVRAADSKDGLQGLVQGIKEAAVKEVAGQKGQSKTGAGAVIQKGKDKVKKVVKETTDLGKDKADAVTKHKAEKATKKAADKADAVVEKALGQ